MFIKQIVPTFLMTLLALSAMSQTPSVYHISENIRKARVHFETSALRYRGASKNGNSGYGFGLGGEFHFLTKTKSRLSLASSLLFNQASEELKTYSVENNSFYYRSTTLTGRLLFATALYYKHNLGKQVQVGVGFQPQFVLHEFKDFYIYGESVSPIPDVKFRKSEVALLASLTYVISPLYTVNFIAQVGGSPVTHATEKTCVDGLRMQISRRIL